MLAPSPLTPLPRWGEGNRGRKGLLILAFLCLPWLTFGQGLPGTQPLDWQGDLSERMMDGAHRFVERKIGESIEKRQLHWKRDFSSRQAYEASVEPNRQRFKKIIGVVDSRLPARMERFGDDDNPALIAETPLYRIFQVRWPVLEGVTGEGLLLEPKIVPAAYIVALPDADQTPEQLAGLATGIQRDAQFARRLAERGVEVLVPVLIDRSSRWSGRPDFGKTDQTHREWIYRQAFVMGRHVIGYEVQKVLAAVDWFKAKSPQAKVGVAGYGEGGLLAFYAAAVDTRIDIALVSGYFASRQEVWSEPIYRNIWGLLEEFGDAELATLIAPRDLLVEYSQEPLVTGHKGDLKPRSLQNLSQEFQRIDKLLRPGFQRNDLVSGVGGLPLTAGSTQALDLFTQWLGIKPLKAPAESQPHDNRRRFDSGDRQRRQVKELENHVQQLVRNSEHVRDRWFAFKVAPELADRTWSRELRHKTLAQASFVQGAKEYREYFWNEVMGRFDEPLLPPNARTRKIYDTEKWVGIRSRTRRVAGGVRLGNPAGAEGYPTWRTPPRGGLPAWTTGSASAGSGRRYPLLSEFRSPPGRSRVCRLRSAQPLSWRRSISLAQPQSQRCQGFAVLVHHQPARSNSAMARSTPVRGWQAYGVLRSKLRRRDRCARAYDS